MNIKSILKEILPDNIICSLKMGFEVFYFALLIRRLEKSKQSFDLLLGTPIHRNLGDHLITMAERELLEKLQYTRTIVEIPTEVYQVYKERLKRLVDKNSIIFINGGGWMGNLWPNEELLLQDMVYTFKDNKTVIFPQTIFYDKSMKPYKELLRSSQRCIMQNSKLYLFVRDRQSYEFAKKCLGCGKIYLCPDVALSYSMEGTERRKYSKTVGYCLRNDRECSRDRQAEKRIRMILGQVGYHGSNVNTMTLIRVPSFLRKYIVCKRLTKFSQFSLIVTDRLHGMIFAYVTNTPCIIFDNKTQKVFGVYEEWLSDVDWIYPVYDSVNQNEIISFIESLEKTKKFKWSEKLDFDILQEIIIND